MRPTAPPSPFGATPSPSARIIHAPFSFSARPMRIRAIGTTHGPTTTWRCASRPIWRWRKIFTIDWRGNLTAEICPLHLGVAEEFSRRVGKNDLSALKDVSPMGYRQCHVRVLLDEKDRGLR